MQVVPDKLVLKDRSRTERGIYPFPKEVELIAPAVKLVLLGFSNLFAVRGVLIGAT